MPRRVPSYRLHKPTGQAVVTLDGRDRYLGKYGSPASRLAYDRLVAEFLATRARRTADTAPPSDLTVNELLLRYWDHARDLYVKEGRPTSEPETIRQALRPVRELYGDTPARDFGPLALKAVRDAMIARGWCRTYINKQVDRVKRMFAWAAANELLPVALYQALRTVTGLRKGCSQAREKPPVGPVDDELVEATLPGLSPTVATMVRLQRLTGMRPQEVVHMRGAEIDRSDPECWVYRPARHKAQHHNRQRLVYLGARAQSLLGRFLEAAGEGYLFSPRRAEEERRAEARARRVSPLRSPAPPRRKAAPKRQPGELYDDGSYRKAIRRACLKLGLSIWFPHQLRHTAASEFRRRYGLEVAQALLGHSELGTTQIYAEVDGAAARRVMREIG